MRHTDDKIPLSEHYRRMQQQELLAGRRHAMQTLATGAVGLTGGFMLGTKAGRDAAAPKEIDPDEPNFVAMKDIKIAVSYVAGQLSYQMAADKAPGETQAEREDTAFKRKNSIQDARTELQNVVNEYPQEILQQFLDKHKNLSGDYYWKQAVVLLEDFMAQAGKTPNENKPQGPSAGLEGTRPVRTR